MPEIFERLPSLVGWAREFQRAVENEIPRRERAEQAHATIAVIDELRERMGNIHPEVDMYLNEALRLARGEFVEQVWTRVEADILRLRAAFDIAARKIESTPATVGRKPKSTRDRLFADIVALLQERSSPRISAAKARTLATKIMNLCGFDTPTDERTLMRRAAGAK